MGDAPQTTFTDIGSTLHLSDHGQLLDVIDHLRALGLDRHVPLPQLVVCGDQSSGKSSVLEAVSGVRFPTKDTLCTRFATELILRRSLSPNVQINIRPSEDRPQDEIAKLLAFEAPSHNIDKFPELIEAAKGVIGIDTDTNRFSEDVLHVELSGPHQPHLTLVDLPGLFHSGNKQQSSDEAKLVKSLVKRYMKQERSIILAVVSAKNDYANQIVTDLAMKFDPKGLRTMGIVTKPDTLIPGSDSETSFLNLARNEDVVFRLGWHVLRNRDFTTREFSTEERDQEEKDFFSRGAWKLLPADILGVDALKPRLSNVLKTQIISVLPNLIGDVERGIENCETGLSRLGDTRATLQEQRQYLIRISQRFSSLVKAAVDGVYDDPFFGDPMTLEGESKRLRAVIQDLLLRLAENMRRKGQYQTIADDSADLASRAGNLIHRSDYLDHVRDLMRRTRGRELPGTFNPLIIGDLFFEQSKPWKALIDRYCREVLEKVKYLIETTLDHTTDTNTADGLLQKMLYPAMEEHTSLLETKVAEVLEPHQRGHAITYNHYFTDTVQKSRREHEEKEQERRIRAMFGVNSNAEAVIPNNIQIATLVRSLGISTEREMDRYACSEATYCMQAYYKVAMKVLIDNFSVLAVEKCMLAKLADILSPDIVIELDDDTVRSIAAEPESAAHERQRITKELKTLREGLVILNRYDRLRTAVDLEEESMVNLEETASVDQGSESGSVVDSPVSPTGSIPIKSRIAEQPAIVAYHPPTPPPLEEVRAEPVAETNDPFALLGTAPSSIKKSKKKGKKVYESEIYDVPAVEPFS